MNPSDLGVVAKAIIDMNMYMVLGTADESGQPWATPVYFGHFEYREFCWISSPEVRHSNNITVRPQISIVIVICEPHADRIVRHDAVYRNQAVLNNPSHVCHSS